MRTGFKKRTDYILTESFVKQYTINWRVFRKASVPFESDHRMPAMICLFPTNAQIKEMRRKRGHAPGAKRSNIKSLAQDERVYTQFSNVSNKEIRTDDMENIADNT